jgi:uncharacterized protein
LVLPAIAFLGTVALVNTGIHLYLWRRLVRGTMRPGRARRVGGFVMLGLGLLIPVTLVGSRAGIRWLAWPGYIWLALMFYLLVTLLVLEIPLLVARVWLRRRAAAGTASTAAVAAAPDAPATRPQPAPAPEPALVGAPDDGTGDGATDVAADLPTGADPMDGPVPVDRPTTADASDARAPVPADGGGDRAAPDPGRRLLLARGAAIFAGLTAAGVVGYGVRTALGPPTVNRVQIPLAKLPRAMDGFRIAQVADIHLGPLAGKAHCERIVAVINGLDADLVAVVGDLVDGSVAELGAAAAPLRDLRARHGSYFVTGNHEYYSGYAEWVDEVDRLGIRPLRNQRQEIGGLDLAGVNDLTGAGFADGPDFGRALDGRDPARPVVLLAHQPVMVHEAAKHGVDLLLAGHTHGGQMQPFGLVVRAVQPVLSGRAEIDGTQVFVTNGAGFWGPPVRVGVPPQVTLVELRTR